MVNKLPSARRAALPQTSGCAALSQGLGAAEQSSFLKLARSTPGPAYPLTRFPTTADSVIVIAKSSQRPCVCEMQMLFPPFWSQRKLDSNEERKCIVQHVCAPAGHSNPAVSLHSHKHHFQTRFATPPLQRRCPKQIATLSFQRVSHTKFSVLSSSLCSCRGTANCCDPLVLSLIQLQIPEWQRWSSSLDAKSQDSRGTAILLLPSVNRIPHDFKCLFIVWKCECFVPKSALLSCPPTRICNHSVGVAIFPTCHQDESMRAHCHGIAKKMPPRVARTVKKNGTRCALNCKNNWSSTRLWDQEKKVRQDVRWTSATWPACQVTERWQKKELNTSRNTELALRHRSTTSRLVARTSFCRDLESAREASLRRFPLRKLQVHPLFVMPSVVFTPKSNIRRNDVDGTMARFQLVARVGEYDKATRVGAACCSEALHRSHQWRHALFLPRDAGMSVGRFHCRLIRHPGIPWSRSQRSLFSCNPVFGVNSFTVAWLHLKSCLENSSIPISWTLSISCIFWVLLLWASRANSSWSLACLFVTFRILVRMINFHTIGLDLSLKFTTCTIAKLCSAFLLQYFGIRVINSRLVCTCFSPASTAVKQAWLVFAHHPNQIPREGLQYSQRDRKSKPYSICWSTSVWPLYC